MKYRSINDDHFLHFERVKDNYRKLCIFFWSLADKSMKEAPYSSTDRHHRIPGVFHDEMLCFSSLLSITQERSIKDSYMYTDSRTFS